jgi:hypothetical protein
MLCTEHILNIKLSCVKLNVLCRFFLLYSHSGMDRVKFIEDNFLETV